ncbi:MAG: hypothetical protein ACOYXT_19810 [Bacteroidota bacterium]
MKSIRNPLIVLFAAYLPAFIPCASYAQVVIGSQAQFGNNPGTEIVIQCSGNLVNNSTFDFSSTNLHVLLTSGDQDLTGNWGVKKLTLMSGVNKRVNGQLSISETLEFNTGVLVPQASGKILFTGSSDGITGASSASFVSGTFYQSGTGVRAFPVGTGTSDFAPLSFENITGTQEIGVRAFKSSASLLPDGLKLVEVNTERYWQITTASNAADINTRVTVSLNGITPFPEGSPVVVQAAQTNMQATNLGVSSKTDQSVTSSTNVTAPIIAIGRVQEVIVKVHDLITPFNLGDDNDKLYIESLEAFDFNRVTLLDRWGTVIKEWTNFKNDLDYDFSTLSPGNYICIVEFGDTDGTTQKVSQMVTVLKTN